MPQGHPIHKKNTIIFTCFVHMLPVSTKTSLAQTTLIGSCGIACRNPQDDGSLPCQSGHVTCSKGVGRGWRRSNRFKPTEWMGARLEAASFEGRGKVRWMTSTPLANKFGVEANKFGGPSDFVSLKAIGGDMTLGGKCGAPLGVQNLTKLFTCFF